MLLKDCPFCKHRAHVIKLEHGWGAKCTACTASRGFATVTTETGGTYTTGLYTTPEEAAKNWNHRGEYHA